MKIPDVIGLGSAFVDYFLEGNNTFFNKHNLKPEFDDIADQKSLFDEALHRLPLLATSSGGASINTIAALAQMGVPSAYYGLIGEDKNTEFFLKGLSQVDMSNVIKKGNMSLCACILSHNRTKRTFASVENRYDNDFFDHMNFTYLNAAKIIHIAPYYLNIPFAYEKLCDAVKNINGSKISLTTAVAYTEIGIQKLAPLLKYVNIIFVNELELALLCKLDKEKGSKKLLSYGPEIVVCTLGEKGALITTKEKQFISKGKKVDTIMDTTGAGDAFAAGFLYGLLENKSLEWSADFANSLAAKAITNYGLSWLQNYTKKELLEEE